MDQQEQFKKLWSVLKSALPPGHKTTYFCSNASGVCDICNCPANQHPAPNYYCP